MVKKAETGKKLTVKKEAVKDLKVKASKGKEIKGGAGRLSQPRTPCDPGCRPC